MINQITNHTHLVMHGQISAAVALVPSMAQPALATVTLRAADSRDLPSTSLTVTTAEQAITLAAAFQRAAEALA